MTLEEIENLLRERKKLPKHVTAIDEMTYTCLSRLPLHDLKLAQKERQKIIAWREDWERTSKLAADIARQHTAFSLAVCKANKEGCEVCREIAKVYDGRSEVFPF